MYNPVEDPVWWTFVAAMASCSVATVGVYIVALRRNRLALETKLADLRQQAKPQPLAADNGREGLVAMPAFKRFRDMAATDGSLPTADDWRALEAAVGEAYPLFAERLLALGRLSPIELQVTLLVKSRFQVKDIARLTCRGKETVSSIRRRLSEKALKSDHPTPKQWDEYVLSL